MIAFDFIYCEPRTLKEAVEIFEQLQKEGKDPLYFAGGSEIITMCRAGSIHPGTVINIKNIPECKFLATDDEFLNIGSVCTLNEIKESKLFPLLRLSCGRIADHTNQCRITLGGNLCGTIIYRETSLPLLLSGANITLFNTGGERKVSFESIFNGRMNLQTGEIVVQLHVPNWALTAPIFHMKITENEKIDYPLVSLAGLVKDNKLRLAISGLCSQPFRSKELEEIVNLRSLSIENRAKKAVELLRENVYSDAQGSGEYRLFVFKNTIEALLEGWEINEKI